MLTHLVAFAYVVGSVVCHQIPERSFHVAGVQLPVCARCTGLYLSGACGLLIGFAGLGHWLTARNAPRVLLVAAMPTVISLVTAALGMWDPPNMERALLAVPLGLTLGIVVAAVLAGKLDRAPTLPNAREERVN